MPSPPLHSVAEEEDESLPLSSVVEEEGESIPLSRLSSTFASTKEEPVYATIGGDTSPPEKPDLGVTATSPSGQLVTSL